MISMKQNNLDVIRESIREISTLDEIYSEIVSSKPQNKAENELKQEEAKFSRDQILKISLNIRNIIKKLK